MIWLLLACTPEPDALGRSVAVLEVCSSGGGSQALLSTTSDGSDFPEGALLEQGCASFEVEPGTWYLQVFEGACYSAWKQVEVDVAGASVEVDYPDCAGEG